MSELGQVVQGLGAMSLTQLLAAFVALGAYALAQGALLEGRARRLGWMVAASATLVFIAEAGQWPHATMLCAIAVAGLGVVAALAWLTSRMLGLARNSGAAASPASQEPGVELQVPGSEAAIEPATSAGRRPTLASLRQKVWPA